MKPLLILSLLGINCFGLSVPNEYIYDCSFQMGKLGSSVILEEKKTVFTIKNGVANQYSEKLSIGNYSALVGAQAQGSLSLQLNISQAAPAGGSSGAQYDGAAERAFHFIHTKDLESYELVCFLQNSDE